MLCSGELGMKRSTCTTCNAVQYLRLRLQQAWTFADGSQTVALAISDFQPLCVDDTLFLLLCFYDISTYPPVTRFREM
jgi:hypothetical protein